MNKEKPHKVELRAEQADALIQRSRQGRLMKEDYPIVTEILINYFALEHAMAEKSRTIMRLMKLVFGYRTEKSKDILKGSKSDENSPRKGDRDSTQSEKKKPKGHGRNGASAYCGAEKVFVPHPCHKAGDQCPFCPKGKLYPFYEPSMVVRIVGRAPLDASVYELEKLRCNLCGELFTAQKPQEAGENKYDETAGAMVSLLKYGGGVPFYRIEKLQQSLGVPLPASTQWDIVERTADKIHPVYQELLRQAAQGEIIHNDDTTMKILANQKEPKPDEQSPSGKGGFTTGVLSVTEERRMALFFTGQKHAGENMAELLRQRASGLSPPIQMCDALSRNMPKEFKTILAHCLSHARRNFVELLSSFPDECQYVIETLATIYHHDKLAKNQNLSAEQRLHFHQRKSGPIMEELKEWLEKQLNEKMVEPNSSMGKAINYMLKHWGPLTLFLRVPGAPLDNNLCEQVLKRAILHRKNSLFFKTEHGAYIGDLFMSLIHTCTLNRVNPFHYLTTLQKHSSELFKNPKRWLPWNYHQAATEGPA
ncbi:MAG: IS66 family transposase [Candidatus Binatia bacterium]